MDRNCNIKAGMAIIVHGICAGWPTYYKVYKSEHYVDIIGINLTTQQVQIADPDRGIIEYSMDEFKEGMLLNKSSCSNCYFKKMSIMINFF
jgi:hypothetical protein